MLRGFKDDGGLGVFISLPSGQRLYTTTYQDCKMENDRNMGTWWQISDLNGLFSISPLRSY
jgi:hypothetical protein